MEVDGVDSSSNPADGGKFANLKSFVTAAREFEATHSESAVNMMARYLGLIASSCDLSIFSPGRSEVCAFFSSLWRVMCDGRGPHWAGVAVLSRAAIEPSPRHALTHTYKFMPILARLLTNSISNDKKVKLLSVMQEISYGIKISWQESYLAGLMKQLTEWITQPMLEPQHRAIGHKSLTVLVNVCYGNLPAIYALMRTVDTKEFVVYLISLKDGGYGGVEVCRLLLCLSGATRGAAATRQSDVHSYLCCTMRTFHKATVERDSVQLLHSYTFINDLCSDGSLRSFVLSYPHFTSALKDGFKDVDELCRAAPEDVGEPENTTNCLRNALKYLTVLVNLDLYSLRCHHSQLVCLCMKASRVCLPESLELFAAIVLQYKDEGRLPQELISVVSDGLPGLLVPPTLEPGKAGLQWLQVVGALCESAETQERVMHEVTPDTFEDTLYSVLQYTSQTGPVGQESSQQAVVVCCRTALSLAPVSREWEAALARMLAHHQVRKLLCAGLTSNNVQRRKQILHLIKHHYFPSDQMSQVFGESLQTSTDMNDLSTSISDTSSNNGCGGCGGSSCCVQRLLPAQEHTIDTLVAKLSDALASGKVSDIATSSVMELYGYKMICLEQRLHSHSVALQGASEHMASLQHALAMLQATNSSQQDVLYTTQMHNERHKKTIEDLHKQLEDAEVTLRGYRAKLAAERLDKENLNKEFRIQLTSIENEMKSREREAEERFRAAETENKALQKKLDQQANKNSELAGVLIKFEDLVKQRDKRLEDANANENALKREIELRETTIKQLEKTVLERENRLYQLNNQLEEMKRVQEMVAKLMSKNSNLHCDAYEERSQIMEKLSSIALPTPRTFSVQLSSGHTARVRLLLPPGLREDEVTKYPLVLKVHGAPGTQLVTEQWSLNWDSLAAGAGAVLASVDARVAGGRGLGAHHALHRRLGTVELADQSEVAEYLRDSLHFIDARRVAVMGRSHGGFLATLALASNLNVFHCGIALTPIVRWRYYASAYAERYMGFPNATGNYRGYADADVTKQAAALHDKMLLLVHGTADDNVHIQQTMALAKSLADQGSMFRQQIYPDEGHSLEGVKRHLYRTMSSFLDDCFRKQVPPESKAGLRNGGTLD